MNNTKKTSIISKDGVSYLIPFILITSCFALWGFANDITNPMVKAFSKIFRMSVTDGALVQVAFYGGYFAMAFPAAMFIRKFSYKAGVLLGLGMYAFGAFLFFPAMLSGSYYPFLIAYFILTQSLYPLDGNGGNGYPSFESGSVVQSDWIVAGNVCSDEFYTESFEPDGYDGTQSAFCY